MEFSIFRLSVNAILMKDIRSLKKETHSFSRQVFPEIHTVGFQGTIADLLRKINTPGRSAWVALIPLVIILTAAFFWGPAYLTCRIISNDTAKLIIDQRITNLATIFSITLVVIGWLITNLTSKESLSLYLMSKSTLLYPIFYYVLGLIGTLIIFSSLREVSFLNFGNVLISASILILAALVFISFLFVQLIKVAHNNFITTALNIEVMRELHEKAKPRIVAEKSWESVKSLCKKLNLHQGTGFGTDLRNHVGVIINPKEDQQEISLSDEEIVEVVFPEEKYRIVDIDFAKLEKAISPLKIDKPCYFPRLMLSQTIPSNYAALYIHSDIEVSKSFDKQIRSAFSIGKSKKNKKAESTQYQDFLHERLKKDVKDGKLENIRSTLLIYTHIFDFENKLISKLNPENSKIEIYGDSMRFIYKSFEISIDNKDVDVLLELRNFIYTQMNNCYQSDNLELFDLSSRFGTYYYEYAVKKLATSTTFREIYDLCCDRAPRELKDRLGWTFRFRTYKDEVSADERRKINRYSKILINRFSDLFDVCYQNKDLPTIKTILNQLHQCSDNYNHQLTELRINISIQRSKKGKDSSGEKLAELENRYNEEGFTNIRVKLLFKASLFWSIFLYQTKILSLDELTLLLKEYESYQGYIESDFLQDLLQLCNFTNSREYAWAGWDYIKKRPEGMTYAPPSVDQWAPFGAIVYLLIRDKSISNEVEQLTPGEVTQIEHLTESMLRILKNVEQAGIDKWSGLLNVATEDQLTAKVQSFRERLEKLQKTNISVRDKMIAEAEINLEYVSNFERILCEGWEKGNVINELFSHFGNIENIEGGRHPILGVKKQVWLGYKTSLIKNDALHIPIFGIERIGQDLADLEEHKFIQQVVEDQRQVKEQDVLLEIDNAIIELERRETPGTVMILGYHIWDTVFGQNRPAHFELDYNKQNELGVSNNGGKYRGIPLVKVRNALMTNSIMICDFEQSFSMKRKTSEGAYKNVLQVKVLPITKEDAISLIAENPAYWQGDLSHEDAIISLMNNIQVDFFLEESFNAKDKGAYQVLLVEN